LQSVTLDFNSGESMRSFTKFIRYRMSESRLMAPKGVNELFRVGRREGVFIIGRWDTKRVQHLCNER
jgi:hypothetical protein